MERTAAIFNRWKAYQMRVCGPPTLLHAAAACPALFAQRPAARATTSQTLRQQQEKRLLWRSAYERESRSAARACDVSARPDLSNRHSACACQRRASRAVSLAYGGHANSHVAAYREISEAQSAQQGSHSLDYLMARVGCAMPVRLASFL
jgi:hypothetical protein